MPIYEYRCEDCGYELEAIQKYSDPPLTDCPTCGKPQLKKLLSVAGFQLKGTGWYATDFKTKDKAAAKKNGENGGGSDGTSGHGCGGGNCSCAH